MGDSARAPALSERPRHLGGAARERSWPPPSRPSPCCSCGPPWWGPTSPSHLRLDALLRLPIEGFVFIALVAVVGPSARRLLVWVLGPLLGLVLIVKLLNIGFFAAFDKPFDPYQDLKYVGFATETVKASLGQATGLLIVVAVGAVVIGVPVLMAVAVRRVSRVAAEHRAGTLRAVGGLVLAWVLCLAVGAQFVPATPIASAGAASLIVSQARAVRADIEDHGVFAREIRNDRFAATPASRLLTGLRGKDVLLLFVESYGKVAVQGTSSRRRRSVLASGDKRLAAAGFSARSAWMTSPTFGGISWLAHSTFQTGLWVDTPQRYEQLLENQRFTLTQAFDRAGWRTVDDVPSDDKPWAPGKTFYHFDKLYNRKNVGYHGPRFAFARDARPVRDVGSATAGAGQAPPPSGLRGGRPRLEPRAMDPHPSDGALGPARRRVDLHKRHEGRWRRRLHVNGLSSYIDINGSPVVRAAYGESIQYTMNALISYVQHYGNKNTVVIVLGDHQPWTVVSGAEPSHEVPISIIARDPSVLSRSPAWGWSDGLRPSPRAPVWPESAFRDRFLARSARSPDGTHMSGDLHDRPYTLLSCALSIDGYLGGTTLRRLELSNDADFDRVDAVRASCDAILVGAATVRHDNPRLLVRSEARREARQGPRHGRHRRSRSPSPSGAELDPRADFFASGEAEKLVYCTSERVPGAALALGPVATVLDGGQPVDMRRISEDLGARRRAADGGGRGTVHTQFLTGNLVDELQLVVAPFFVGDSRATRFVRDGRFPWNPDRRATLSEVRQIGDVVLLRYALSSRFQDD